MLCSIYHQNGQVQGLTSSTWIRGIVGNALFFDLGAPSPVFVQLPSLLTIKSTFTMSMWVIPRVQVYPVPEANSGVSGISGQKYLIDPQWGGSSAIAAIDPTAAGVGLSVGTNGIYVVCLASAPSRMLSCVAVRARCKLSAGGAGVSNHAAQHVDAHCRRVL